MEYILPFHIFWKRHILEPVSHFTIKTDEPPCKVLESHMNGLGFGSFVTSQIQFPYLKGKVEK